MITNNRNRTTTINDVEPFTQENIKNIPQSKLILLKSKEGNLYGFDIDALNNYLAKETNHPKNPFTMEPFSKENKKEIKEFTKKGNHHKPEKEHPIWKSVDDLGHEIQSKSSLEMYKKYEKTMEGIKKNWNDFLQNGTTNVKKEINEHFLRQIYQEMKKVRVDLSGQNVHNNHSMEEETDSSSEEDNDSSYSESDSEMDYNFDFCSSHRNNNNNQYHSFQIFSYRYHPYNLHNHNTTIRRRISSHYNTMRVDTNRNIFRRCNFNRNRVYRSHLDISFIS